MDHQVTATVAAHAVALRRSHPQATAIEILDLVLTGRSGSTSDFGPAIEPASPFALIVAEAFDSGMAPQDWVALMGPHGEPAVKSELRRIWATYVLPKLAARYGLRT